MQLVDEQSRSRFESQDGLAVLQESHTNLAKTGKKTSVICKNETMRNRKVTFKLNSVIKAIIVLFLFAVAFSQADGELQRGIFRKFYNCSANSTILPTTQAEPNSLKAKAEKTFAVVLASDMMHQVRVREIKRLARKECTDISGTYSERSGHCFRLKRLENGSTYCQTTTYKSYIFILDLKRKERAEYWLYIIGNAWSLAATVLLLLTYVFDKELHTSYGRSIVFLSANTMFQQVMQILSLESRDSVKQCTAIAILHHWSYLVMFFWMASIAFDFSITFSRFRRPTPQTQQRRFQIYAFTSEVIPTLFVVLCVFIDFTSDKTHIGYGEANTCFITNYIANILAFSFPIACIIIFNIICLGITLVFIAKTRHNSRLVLGSNSSRKKDNLTLVIMALKLSFLLGIGWVFGPIARVSQNESLVYVYVFFTTFQGFFIFSAFCLNQKVFRFYREKIRIVSNSFRSAQSVDHTMETDF